MCKTEQDVFNIVKETKVSFIEKKIEWDCYRTHVSQYELEKYLPII